MRNGALLIDTRPASQRERDGEISGAIVIDRNVLEWRQVILTQRPIDADLMTCYVGTEFAVGEVNVGQRPAIVAGAGSG
jgi:hypothetical protein